LRCTFCVCDTDGEVEGSADVVERDALAEFRLKIDVGQLAVVDPGGSVRRE